MTLDDICKSFGVRTDYGDQAPVPDATKRAVLEALGADPERLLRVDEFEPVSAQNGVTCHLPDWLIDTSAWGIFCQLYELRSERNWGIGDFQDLADLCRIAAAAGADFLGVNPIHALFLAAPERCSPFTPSNRRFLNPLYIAMDDLPGPAKADEAQLSALRAADLVDYGTVTNLKLAALRAVFAARPFDDARFTRAAFEEFVSAGGAALSGHALFDALSLHLVSEGHEAGWTSWPEDYAIPQMPAVIAFARHHADEVRFHQWLQWIASVQLASAQAAARAAGMRIGIYLDLAVGEAPDGSATWSAPDAVLAGLTVGAPPDVFSQSGQNWRLAAPSPTAMAKDDFAMFRQLITAQLRYAGALRVDHAMALWQLFLIPDGQSAAAGTHLRYPFADLLRVLAEESEKAGAIVVGEDLGYVPPGFRDTMQAARLLGYRILYFEQEYGMFQRSGTYPQMALACLSTHDLPTLGEWWQGGDIALRERFGLIDATAAESDRNWRRDERRALVAALVDGGQLAPGAENSEAEELPPGVLVAAYRFLAATPCLLAAVRLADLIGPAAATNVPGTVDEYPNWRKRAPVMIEEIAATPAFKLVTTAMRDRRSSASE